MNRVLLLVALLPAAASLSAQSVLIANFENNGTDKMCENRFSRYTSGGSEVGAQLETTENPLKEAGYNSSNQTLRVYDVNYTGCIKLNLTNVANASDKLNISGCNALRLKYRVNDSRAFGTLNARIKLNGAGDAITGEWSNVDREWKTVRFVFPEGSPASVSMIQIFLYYGVGWSAGITEGLEIYIDDVEAYATAQPAELSMISVDGKAIEFFKSDVYHYAVYFPYTQSALPAIACVRANANQEVTVQPAISLAGGEAERTSVITVAEGEAVKTYRVTYEVAPKLDIYLCLGQSNMSGYGEILPEDEGVIAGAFLLTPGANFHPATNPLNRFSTIANSVAKISPAYGFALGLQGLQNPIGLLVNARNGSSIDWWAKGNTEYALYDHTLARALEAKKWGEIRGILWHQGCSDSWNASGYPPKLQTLVANFRTDLGLENLYFVAGELGYWRQNGTGSTAFNTMIRTVASFISNADWVSAEGLTCYKDETDPHFSRESAIELGRRYAEKVRNRIYPTATRRPNTPAPFALLGREMRINQLPVDSRFCLWDVGGRRLCAGKDAASYTFNGPGIYLLQTSGAQGGDVYRIVVK